MQASVSEIICDISDSGSPFIEGEKYFEESNLSPDDQKLFAKYLKKSPRFRYIWVGKIADVHIKIQSLLEYDSKGRLLYRGNPYNKDTWTAFFVVDNLLWGPPPVIRDQGRYAKEQFDPRNDYPTEVVEDNHGNKLRVLRYCDGCGGDLEYDHRMVLYCKKCFLEFK